MSLLFLCCGHRPRPRIPPRAAAARRATSAPAPEGAAASRPPFHNPEEQNCQRVLLSFRHSVCIVLHPPKILGKLEQKAYDKIIIKKMRVRK